MIPCYIDRLIYRIGRFQNLELLEVGCLFGAWSSLGVMGCVCWSGNLVARDLIWKMVSHDPEER